MASTSNTFCDCCDQTKIASQSFQTKSYLALLGNKVWFDLVTKKQQENNQVRPTLIQILNIEASSHSLIPFFSSISRFPLETDFIWFTYHQVPIKKAKFFKRNRKILRSGFSLSKSLQFVIFLGTHCLIWIWILIGCLHKLYCWK